MAIEWVIPWLPIAELARLKPQEKVLKPNLPGRLSPLPSQLQWA